MSRDPDSSPDSEHNADPVNGVSRYGSDDTQLDKAAHPLELFFDLVFVFAITQVVSLLVHDLSLAGTLRGILVLALLWWGWGNWAWTTNVVDLGPRLVRVVVLVSMLGVFGMAFAVPTAFGDGAVWIALGYAWVRVLGGAVMYLGTRDDPVEQKAIATYMPISMTSPAIVILGAAVGGAAQAWIWLVALAVELLAAVVAGRADWRVNAAHFAERHALIVIIALGEAIIAVGVALEGFEIDVSLVMRLAVGLAGVAAMWWAYFDRMQEAWETALRRSEGRDTGHIARDVYSLLHYPMIVGIVFYAVALEEAFLRPDDPMPTVVAVIFGTASALYLLAMVAATYRCWGTFLYERVIGVVLTVGIVLLWDGAADDVVLGSTLVLMATLSVEYWRFRSRIRGEVTSTAN